MNKNLIAIETSNQACSVALYVKGQYYQSHEMVGNQHSSYLYHQISQLLDDANISFRDLDHIIVGNGPGMFTGIRVGVGLCQGLGLALDIPVTAYSSLVSLACDQSLLTSDAFNQLSSEKIVLSLIDAKMSELYGQWFFLDANHRYTILSEPILYKPHETDVFEVWFDDMQRHCKKLKSTSHSDCLVVVDGVSLLPSDEIIKTFLMKKELDVSLSYYPSFMPSAYSLLRALVEKVLIDGDVFDSEIVNIKKSDQVTANYVRDDVAHKAKGR